MRQALVQSVVVDFNDFSDALILYQLYEGTVVNSNNTNLLFDR